MAVSFSGIGEWLCHFQESPRMTGALQDTLESITFEFIEFSV